MSERLHGRRVILEIGQPGEPGVSIEGLPIAFDIQFKLDGKPNQGAITASGVARDLYGAAQQPGAIVRLFAGYNTPKLIFTGDPIPRIGVKYGHAVGTRVLEIQALDTGSKYSNTYVDISIDGQTTLKQVVDAIAVALALPVGPLPPELSTLQFGEGFYASGKPDAVLARVGAMADLDFTTRDGALLAIPRSGHSGEPVVVLSTAGGNLLNMQQQKDGTIEYTALLDGSIRPGRRIVFDHPDFKGQAKARDVRFHGDPGWAAPFYTSGTARAL